MLGQYHPGAGLALVRHVVELSETEGVDRVLLDGSEMEGDFSAAQRYTLAEKAAEFLPPTIRMGVVAHPADVGLPVIEVVAIEQGFPLRVFDSRNEALGWLTSPSTKP